MSEYENVVLNQPFNNLYGIKNLSDEPVQESPTFGEWEIVDFIMSPIGRIFNFQRGLFIHEKFIDEFKKFNVAPFQLFEMQYKLSGESYQTFEKKGKFFCIWFYQSGFNFIDWSESHFLISEKKTYKRNELISQKLVGFESKDDFLSFSIKNQESFNIFPKEIHLSKDFPNYDLFGLFYFNDYLTISKKCYDKMKVHGFFHKAIVKINKKYTITST